MVVGKNKHASLIFLTPPIYSFQKNKEMFGSKKKENTPAANRKNTAPTSTSNALNSLVKGTKIEGTVSSENDIRVDGVILGTLTCKAKVIIGPTGVIEGDVKCENAVIEGHLKGNLVVAQLPRARFFATAQALCHAVLRHLGPADSTN